MNVVEMTMNSKAKFHRKLYVIARTEDVLNAI
jgi:hypothetical protein